MIDLTFFTSNPTKLAHARYLVEAESIKIKGFRQRTYHASYQEPRILSRPALLEASYRSAIAQCKKAGLATNKHLFILEDTSVRIDGLSDPQQDVPGLDIKYWMRDATFERVDRDLRRAGNVRTATVRSDVLLHIPEAYKELWGLESHDYLTFVGEQQGSIVDTELSYDSNLVYPWLDNHSFNKWFLPDGASAPLGALKIDEADKYDFRKKSFGGLVDFLRKRRMIPSGSVQYKLSLDERPVIVLCGYTCSGKTIASQHLSKNYGYLHLEASDFMHLSYWNRHGFNSRVSVRDFAEQALQSIPHIAAEKIFDHLKRHSLATAVISGFRSKDEVDWLMERLIRAGKSCYVGYVEANAEIRFRRMCERARTGDEMQRSKFDLRDEQQRRMGLDHIKGASYTHLWDNEASVQDYFDTIDAQPELLRLPKSTVGDPIQNLELIRGLGVIKLEDAILVGLLSVWSSQESRQHYTTTEISKIINDLFTNIQPKHKDNVSRYFNQDYYPYYDVESVPGRSYSRYRLSNTGYGRAVEILNRLVQSGVAGAAVQPS